MHFPQHARATTGPLFQEDAKTLNTPARTLFSLPQDFHFLDKHLCAHREEEEKALYRSRFCNFIYLTIAAGHLIRDHLHFPKRPALHK